GPEELLALLAGGDVDDESLLIEWNAVGIEGRLHQVEQPAGAPVGAYEAVLELEWVAALARLPLGEANSIEIVGMDDRVPEVGILEEGLRRMAELLDLGAHVCVLEHGLQVVDVRDERQLLDQPPVL